LRKFTASASLLLFAALPVRAQVVLDGSLGSSGNIPLIDGEYAITDDLGRYSSGGENLFYSFGGAVEVGKSGFDIGFGETAHFSASLGTPDRVIARVTSGFRSQINGKIRSSITDADLRGADLFLLNASGISLGDGAELDLQGSFYTSTADVLRFGSGPDLLVADATPDPLLSVAAPVAFGFTSASPALIEVARTNKLKVPASKTLSIVGGDVFVTGQPGFGVADVIAAPGALLEIAAAAGPVDIPVSLVDFDLDAVDPAALGLVSISAFAKIQMSGADETPSGGVLIRSGAFVLASDAQILAKNNADTAAAQGPIDIAVSRGDPKQLASAGDFGSLQGGDLVIQRGDLVLDGSNSQIQSWTAGEGRAGDVRLSGDRVLLRNGADLILFNGGSPSHTGEGPDAWLSGRVVGLDTGAEILIRALSSGPVSSVKLEATEQIDIQNGASVISGLLAGNSGDGGVLAFDSASVSVAGDAQISTLNNGARAGATIEIFADALTVSDGGGIVSRTDADGAGGRIHLDVGSLSVTDAGRVTSDTTGGPGGAIDVWADSVFVSNATDRAEGTFIEAKNGGSIALDADLVELVHGGQIFTRAEGAIAAGPLTITNADRVSASGVDADDRPSGLFSRTTALGDGAGDGGLLSVQTRILELDDGAEFSSSTSGAGNAGRIELYDSERISVRGGTNGVSLVASSALPGSTGDGGTIEIDTDQLELRDGGRVTTSTFGGGNAGRIDAYAGVIEISGVDPLAGINSAGFFSRSLGGGDGGSVALHARQSVSMSDRALISTSSTDIGLAGDILIDAGNRLQMEDSLITTKADISAGGNVEITAAELVSLNRSAIQTLVLDGVGGGGDVTIGNLTIDGVTIDPVFTVLNESNVTASAIGGPGGNILIVTDFYFQSGTSFLDASSVDDVDGTIDVTPPDTDLVSSIAALPASYFDASSRLERDCSARSARAGSFVVRAGELALAPPDAALTASDLSYCRRKENTL
jgi:filamentous hemagglutinin family protein